MDDIAKLGFEIDNSPLLNAAKVSATAAAQIGKVGDAADATSKKVTGAGRSAQAAAGAIGAVGNASGAAAPKVQAAGKAQDALAQALDKTTTAATAEARAAQSAAAQTDRLGDAADRASGRVAAMSGVLKQVGDAGQGAVSKIASLSQAFGVATGSTGGAALSSALSTSTSMLGGLTGALGRFGPLAASAVTVVAAVATATLGLQAALASVQDRWRSYEGQLKNTLGSTQAARAAIDELYKTAQGSGISFDSTVQSFNRLARNATELGATNSEILQLSSTIQKLGVVSGAGQGEIASGMMQLSQALAAGKLNGDELRSIMENMPALAKAIADGLGVSVGALRAMGAAGELSGDKVFRALLSGSDKVQKQFEEMPDTTERAFQRVSDSWSRMLARMGEKANSSGFIQSILGATNRVITAMTPAARNLTKEEEDLQELRAQAEAYRDMPGREGERKRASLSSQIRLLQPIVDAQTAKAQAESAKAAEQEAARPALGLFARGANAAKSVQLPGATVSELQDQLFNIESALIAAGQRRSPSTLPADQRPDTRQLQQMESAIVALRQKMQDAAGSLTAFSQAAVDFSEQIRIGGGGGGVGIVAEAQDLARKSRGEGVPATTSGLIRQIADDRASRSVADAVALDRQAEAQTKLLQTVGKTRNEVREAEIAQESLDFRYQQFGKVTTPAVEEAVKRYAWSLRQLKKDQDALADARATKALQDRIDVLQAGNKFIGQGGFLMRNAEAEQRALQDERQTPGLLAGRQREFDLQEGRVVEQQLFRMIEQNQMTQARVNAVGNAALERQLDLRQRILDLQREAPPGRRAELAQQATIADQLERELSARRAIRQIEDNITVSMAGQVGLRQGEFEGRRAQAEARADIAERQTPGIKSALEREFVQSERSSADQLIANLERQTEKNRRMVVASYNEGSGGQRRLELDMRINDAVRGVAPDRREALAEAMRTENETATTRSLFEQSQVLKEQRDMQRQQLQLVGLETEERTVQEALLLKRTELLRQGVDLQSSEARVLLGRTAEAARSGVQLDKARSDAQAWAGVWENAGNGVGNAISDAFLASFDKTKKAGDVLRQGLSDTFKRMAADILSQTFKPLQDALTGMLKGIASSISGAFGNPAAVPIGPFGAASGAYFAGGQASFAYGGVVNGPTMFRFAQGGVMRPGLMGEAGPEAIMPLRRGSDGRLGVSAAGAGGGGGGTYNISVNVDASGRSSSQEAQGGDAADNRGQRLGEVVASAVRAEIIQQQRPGGLLARR